jgi:hypothetical protein
MEKHENETDTDVYKWKDEDDVQYGSEYLRADD